MGKDALYVSWNGGGGFGDPLEREPDSVLRDVKDGIVSLDTARNIYGVVFADDSRAVDIAATASLRDQLYAQRLGREAAE